MKIPLKRLRTRNLCRAVILIAYFAYKHTEIKTKYTANHFVNSIPIHEYGQIDSKSTTTLILTIN
jgi:hypothetical protein